jgi:hypothetical protein
MDFYLVTEGRFLHNRKYSNMTAMTTTAAIIPPMIHKFTFLAGGVVVVVGVVGDVVIVVVVVGVVVDVVVVVVVTGVITVKFTAGLVTPDRTAVILIVPAAMPVAKPVADIVAMVVSELAQVT